MTTEGGAVTVCGLPGKLSALVVCCNGLEKSGKEQESVEGLTSGDVDMGLICWNVVEGPVSCDIPDVDHKGPVCRAIGEGYGTSVGRFDA